MYCFGPISTGMIPAYLATAHATIPKITVTVLTDISVVSKYEQQCTKNANIQVAEVPA